MFEEYQPKPTFDLKKCFHFFLTNDFILHYLFIDTLSNLLTHEIKKHTFSKRIEALVISRMFRIILNIDIICHIRPFIN